MRRWALIQNGIVTRLADGLTNPFHRAARVVEVTGMDTSVGHIADAQGNTGSGPAMTAPQALSAKQGLLRHETHFQIQRGVWLPSGDKGGALFDVHHEALAALAAMAAAGAGHVPAMDGHLVEIDAAGVFKAAGQYIADCYEREAEIRANLADEPETDITVGWPENGEPETDGAASNPVTAADLADTSVAGSQALQGAETRAMVPPVATPEGEAPQPPAAEPAPTE